MTDGSYEYAALAMRLKVDSLRAELSQLRLAYVYHIAEVKKELGRFYVDGRSLTDCIADMRKVLESWEAADGKGS